MRNVLSSLATAATLAAFAAVLVGSPARVTAADVPVAVGDLYFCDASFQDAVCQTTIAVGDRVVWTVQSGAHTVTECNSTFAACPPSGGFDSGTLTQGQQFDRTFNSAGTFHYECVFHPQQMRGQIVVQATQATPTPTPSATPSPTATGTGAATATATASATPAAVPAAGGEPGGEAAGSTAGPAIIAGTLMAVAGLFAVRRFWAAGHNSKPDTMRR